MNKIMFGNGLNMLTEGNSSWADLVSVIETAKYEERIPFTLQYEAKLSDSKKSYQRANNEILEKIVKTLKRYKSNGISDRLASFGVEHYAKGTSFSKSSEPVENTKQSKSKEAKLGSICYA